MYECIKLAIPVILHSIEFEILTFTMLKIAFPGLQISKCSGGGGDMPQDPPRGSYLITPLNKYSCQYEHPSKNLSYAPVLHMTNYMAIGLCMDKRMQNALVWTYPVEAG